MDNNSSTTPEPIGAAVLVINQAGQLLLGERKGGYLPGTFGLPGGRLDGQESLTDIAKRELAEETALTANTLEYVGVVREWQTDKNFIHFIYLCRDFAGTLTTTEPQKCAGWQWYDLNSLPEPLLRGHAAAIALYKEHETIADLNAADLGL